MSRHWKKFTGKKPGPLNSFGDSESFLCFDSGIGAPPFVAWYQGIAKIWIVTHHYAGNEAAQVTHYRELPKHPKHPK